MSPTSESAFGDDENIERSADASGCRMKPPAQRANTHTVAPRFGGLTNSGTSGAKLRA
jgi:hypothetical protein